jgi:DNA invertase Pin-like site-specific DNA recombinase
MIPVRQLWEAFMGRKKRFVAYYRVSTTKQGEAGLGLSAQVEAVSRFLTTQSAGPEQPIAEYTEIESGKGHTNRPQLLAAIAHCRKEKAVLVIAKLDRLARNVHFISGLMESGVEFVAADMPDANKLTVHIMAAMAEYEREAISQRTKAALEAAKARGTKLGNPRWHESIQAARAAKGIIPPAPAVMDVMEKLRVEGLTLRAIADRLNALGLHTPKGSSWYASTVRGALVNAA